MEIVISAETIITIGKVLSALAVIGGAIAWIAKFVSRQKSHEEAIAELRKEMAEQNAATQHELTMICYGLLACLKGLQEQGCNGPVTEARNMLEKHLNQAAHGDG